MPKIFNDDFHITSHKLKEILDVFQKKIRYSIISGEREKYTGVNGSMGQRVC